jgi:hypothetical protein
VELPVDWSLLAMRDMPRPCWNLQAGQHNSTKVHILEGPPAAAAVVAVAPSAEQTATTGQRMTPAFGSGLHDVAAVFQTTQSRCFRAVAGAGPDADAEVC